ncbi:hypothetical protein VNI00_005817 [Paramarasmius palmivorus]|uniref:RNA 3'-terminal phosphate cyclase n=1 Tax=Paramarasmius palmivorus TaxID=297713 RepID=A0AAW0DGS6_9AGAR
MSALANAVIDGSVLEGGGQILRNAVGLSGLLYKPVAIQKIRNGRKEPGLKQQHRTGLELAAEITGAQLTGATNGSTEIHFNPDPERGHSSHHYEADSVTAGSTMLLLQIALPLLLFRREKSNVTLNLKGGTNASQAPQADYTQHVFLPFVRKNFGISVEMVFKRRGYYPKGGGEVHVRTETISGPLPGVSMLERGRVRSINGIAHFAGLPNQVGTSMVKGALERLADGGYTTSEDLPVNIQYRRERNDNTTGAGSGIVLWAELEGGGMLGGSALGKKGVDALEVGKEAAAELVKAIEAGGCVDKWLQDQIIIFMALADGKSEIQCGNQGLELHTK